MKNLIKPKQNLQYILLWVCSHTDAVLKLLPVYIKAKQVFIIHQVFLILNCALKYLTLSRDTVT